MGTSIGFDIFAKDRSASKTFNQVGDSAERAGGRLRRFGQIARTAAKATAVGVGLAAVAGWKLAEAAAEDEQSARQMAVAFRNNARATRSQISATEAWITKQGLAKGVADDQLRPALSKLVTATHDVGQAQSLASLAMDVSAGTGKDLGAVSLALAKAHGGNVGALSRLGIATKNAKGETLTFDQAVRKMSQTFKGQADSAADTTAGKFARAKLAFSEAGEALGYKLLPPVTAVATWLVSTGIPAMERFGSAMGSLLGPAASKIGSLFSAFGKGDGGGMSKTASSIRSIGSSLRPLVTEYGTKLKSAFSAMGSALSDIGSVVKSDLLPALRDIAPVVAPIAKVFLQVMGNNVVTAIKIVGGVVKGFVTGLSGAINVVSGLLTGNWSRAWKGMGQVTRGQGGIVRSIVGNLLGNLRTNFTTVLGQIAGAVWRGFWTGLRALPGAALRAVVGVVRTQLGLARSAIVNGARAAVAGFRGQFRALRGAAAAGLNAARSAVGNGISAIRSGFSRGVSAVVGLVRSGFSRVAGGVRSGISGAASAARSLPGRVRSAVGNLGNLLFSAGGDVARGFANGIRASIGNAVSAASSLANAIPGKVRKLLGIASPSRVMMRLGGWITEGLAKGLVGSKLKTLDAAQDRLVGKVKGLRKKLADLRGKRDEFASGFNFSSSAFGADYGEFGPSVGGVLQFQRSQLAQAQQVNRDVATLTKRGLSKSLIRQMQASGESGIAVMRQLAASGTRADISQLNSLDKQTQSAYGRAGMTAANAIYGDAIRSTRNKVLDGARLSRAIEKMERTLSRELAKGDRIVLELDGKVLVGAIKRDNRKKGR